MDVPYIDTQQNMLLSARTVKCVAEFYESERIDYTIFQISKKQYTYSIRGYKVLSLHITHNHKILTNRGWKKVDQLKRNILHCARFNNQTKYTLTIEVKKLASIKLLVKEKVYDISMGQYSNFLIGRHIVHNSIEQDADLVLMLYQNAKENDDDKIDIVIAKHRNGPIGSFQLLFHADICKFSNIHNTSLANMY